MASYTLQVRPSDAVGAHPAFDALLEHLKEHTALDGNAKSWNEDGTYADDGNETMRLRWGASCWI